MTALLQKLLKAAAPYLGPAAIGCALGLALGWTLWRPKPRVAETPAAAVVQRDGSTILARAPDAHAKAPMLTPKGTLERVVKLVVQAKPETTVVHDTVSAISGTMGMDSVISSGYASDSGKNVTIRCPPIEVDLALVREKDGSKRVVAKPPNGTILSGVDIPVETAAPERTLPWAVGPIYDVGSRSWGAAVTRNLAPLQILGAVTRERMGGVGLIVGLALRF